MEKSNLSTAMQQAQTALRKYWYVAGLLLLCAGLFLVGSWYGQSKVADHKGAGSRPILYYVDPMNPSHTSPEPGLAPCGMKMEPVYADAGDQPAGPVMSPGSVKVTPEKQQIIGVRVAAVEKSPWTYTLRTVGKVAVDENRVYRLNAFAEGWVESVYDNSTGSLVRKDEPLAALYNKDLLPGLQAYYYADNAVENLKQEQNLQAAQKSLLEIQQRTAEKALLNMGLSKQQLKDLVSKQELTQEIILSAPVTSFVLARNITPGQKFTTGEELYRLGDLSRVWILADVFEDEAKYIHPGEKVRVTLPRQDEQYVATVSEVLPLFDPATLTLKVRLEVNNPKFVLRPGMFVDVEFPINLPPAVNVPVDAIMDSGAKKTVFVDRGKGFFEPRRVKTGWRLGDRAEITEGLVPGDRIATSGNFLIDSESRMRLAAAGMYGEVTKDPVCGLNVDENKAKAAGFRSTFKDHTYYFCSEACQKHFDKNPGRYAGTSGEVPEAARGAAGGKGHDAQAVKPKDPVCGHEVDEAQSKAAGLTSDYQGKNYYFCSYSCNKQFDKDPERYLHMEAQAECGAHQDQQHATPATAKDPVCGLPVDLGKSQAKQLKSEYEGKSYYFDTAGCKQRFDKDPTRYLSASSGATSPLTYPNAPTDPFSPLQFKKNLMRSVPRGSNSAVPHRSAPSAPYGRGPLVKYGPAPTALPGSTPAAPPGETPPVAPTATPAVPPAATPTATPVAPPGPVQVAPPGTAQAVPPKPATTAPPGPAQAAPRGTPPPVAPGATPAAPPAAAPGEPQVAIPGAVPATPRGPSPALPRGLRTKVTRGPTPEMRERAYQALREREAEALREREAEKATQGPTPVVPQGPQVKPQTPPIPPAPPQTPPKGQPPAPPPAQPLCPPGTGDH